MAKGGTIQDLFPPGNNAAAVAREATAKRAASQVKNAPPFGGSQVVPASSKEKFDRPKPAAIAEISDAGRAALAAAQGPPPGTGVTTALQRLAEVGIKEEGVK